MKKNKELYYIDILNSIEEIESYFSHNVYNFNEFLKDVKTKRAVERNLSIIGEAVNSILKIVNKSSVLTACKQSVKPPPFKKGGKLSGFSSLFSPFFQKGGDLR